MLLGDYLGLFVKGEVVATTRVRVSPGAATAGEALDLKFYPEAAIEKAPEVESALTKRPAPTKRGN